MGDRVAAMEATGVEAVIPAEGAVAEVAEAGIETLRVESPTAGPWALRRLAKA